MRLHRFYIKENLEKGKEIRIEDSELIHQWSKVFRLKAGDRVIIFNGNSKEFEGYFKILAKKEAILMIDKENKRMVLASKGKYPSVRLHNRCRLCGRPRGFYRDFGLCRCCLRKMAHGGLLPGVTKSSW